jgi:hypothetical protein
VAPLPWSCIKQLKNCIPVQYLGDVVFGQATRPRETTTLDLPLSGANSGKGVFCGYATRHRLIVIYHRSPVGSKWMPGSMSVHVLSSAFPEMARSSKWLPYVQFAVSSGCQLTSGVHKAHIEFPKSPWANTFRSLLSMLSTAFSSHITQQPHA